MNINKNVILFIFKSVIGIYFKLSTNTNISGFSAWRTNYKENE